MKAAIDILNRHVDIYGEGLSLAGKWVEIQHAIRVLEAAGKLPLTRQELLGWLNRAETIMRYSGDEDPQDDECTGIIRALLEALPDSDVFPK